MSAHALNLQESNKADTSYVPPPPNHGPSPPFSILTRLFERLQSERKFDKRKRAVEVWLKNYREEVGNDLYDVLRLILPQKDRERAVYQVKEKNLAKLFIGAIPLGKMDPDAVRLLNWKKPMGEDRTAGDFPTILYEVLSKRSSVVSTSLSITEVNSALDELAKAGGKMNQQMEPIQVLYNKCTPADQRWIIRIVLKDLLIAVKETTVFSVFHPDAQALFNTCSDLKRVAYELWDPKHSLNPDEKSVKIFHAFTPMLCKRPLQNIEESVKKMSGLEFIIEEKLDGERMQLHKRGNEYFYCSRKGKDYTYLYGKHAGEGGLTPHIHGKAFHEDALELIIDGEMLVYDPESDRYLPFGHLKTAALDKSKKIDRPRPCFKVFDILLINGVSLLEKSTVVRRRNLQHTVQEVKGYIEYATSWKGKTAKDVRVRMEEIMNARGEGLVLKHPQSQYTLNGRNEDWIKVKPEYLDNMGETVDVLVTGGNYGTGRRGGGVSALICSVRDDTSSDDHEVKYRTFVRIGSGFSYTDYLQIRSKPWKPYDKKNPPSWLLSASKGLEDKADVYLEPENSFILKVKAAEITPTEQYHMGLTMRFPRALTIRDDLDICDCATATEIKDELRKERKRKLESGTSTAAKKRRMVASSKTKVIEAPHRKAPKDINQVETESNIFKGMKFHVLLEGKPTTPSVASKTKHALERLIVAHGGDFTAGYKHDHSVMLIYGGSSKPAPVAMVIRAGDRDIIRAQWLTDCVNRGRALPKRQKYYFFATELRQAEAEFGGSDTEDDDWEVLADKHDRVPSNHPEHTIDEQRKPGHDERASSLLTGVDSMDDAESNTDPESDQDEDEQVVSSSTEDGSETEVSVRIANKDGEEMTYDEEKIFRHLCFYLDTTANAVANDLEASTIGGDQRLEELQMKIMANGGEIVDLEDPRLTHVIFDPDDTSRRLDIRRQICSEMERYLVVADWVEASLQENTLADERMFDA